MFMSKGGKGAKSKKDGKAESKKHWEAYFKATLKQEWDKGITALVALQGIEPRNTQIFQKLGDLQQRIGENSAAITSYKKAARGQLNAGFGQKAIAIYKIILRLDPKDQTTLDEINSILNKIDEPSPLINTTMGEPGEITTSVSPESATEPVLKTVTTDGWQDKSDSHEPAPQLQPMPPGGWSNDEAAQEGGNLPPLDAGSDSAPEGWPASDEMPAQSVAESTAAPMPSDAAAAPELFASLSQSARDELTAKSRTVRYKKDDTIVREGDRGDTLFVIAQGTVRVEASILGRHIELARLGAGEVFGEVSYLTGRPRSATVIAESDVELLSINKEVFEEAAHKNPRLLDSLAEFYYSRVQDTLDKVRNKPL